MRIVKKGGIRKAQKDQKVCLEKEYFIFNKFEVFNML